MKNHHLMISTVFVAISSAIQGSLSPFIEEKPRCNVCYRKCPICQCPERELIYDAEIKILD